MRNALSNLLGILLLGVLFAIGCGGMLLDANQVDRAILRWEGR